MSIGRAMGPCAKTCACKQRVITLGVYILNAYRDRVPMTVFSIVISELFMSSLSTCTVHEMYVHDASQSCVANGARDSRASHRWHVF